MPLQTGQVVAIKKIQVGEKGEVRLKALASARICRRSAPLPPPLPLLHSPALAPRSTYLSRPSCLPNRAST